MPPRGDSPAAVSATAEVDHHVHIWSPQAAQLLRAATLQDPNIAHETVSSEPITADELIADLDRDGVQRAVVLSVAYWFDSPHLPSKGDKTAQIRAENDWVAAQVSRYSDRLIAFCSFNPIASEAIEDLNRCARDRRFRGVKLHLGNSGVDLRNAAHLQRLGQVFAELDRRRVPVIVHLWTGPSYGRADAQAFLDQVLSRAPRIAIQIAHLAGTGPGYGPEEAVAVFADASSAGDRRMVNVLFDVASVVTANQKTEALAMIARRLRQIGLEKLVFGSDSARGFNPPSGQAWQNFRRLPLTESEFALIARNTAPYLR